MAAFVRRHNNYSINIISTHINKMTLERNDPADGLAVEFVDDSEGRWILAFRRLID